MPPAQPSPMSPLEYRFRAALGALARAGERAGLYHFGGLQLADLNHESGLLVEHALRQTRAHLEDEWRHAAASSAARAQLVEVAEDMVAQLRRRNSLIGNWWTPGGIADEMNETNAEIEAVGRDVYISLIEPYRAARDKAIEAFRARERREPSTDDVTRLEEAMGATPVDIEQGAYNGQLVKQWRAFVQEWETFRVRRSGSWLNRMWGNTGDQARRYRERARDWRERLAKEGVKLTTPPPKIPSLSAVPWDRVVGVLGLVAAIAIVPPLISALSDKR